MIHPFGPSGPRANEVSSPFGAERGVDRIRHKGTDLRCPVGTPLHIVGRVVRLDTVPTAPNGLAVWWEYDGVRCVYLHMSRIDVRVGDDLGGEIAGLSGNTGASEGPHVHIGVWTQGATSADRLLLDPGRVWGYQSWTIWPLAGPPGPPAQTDILEPHPW